MREEGGMGASQVGGGEEYSYKSSKGGSHSKFSHVNLHTHPLVWLLIGSRGC